MEESEKRREKGEERKEKREERREKREERREKREERSVVYLEPFKIVKLLEEVSPTHVGFI